MYDAGTVAPEPQLRQGEVYWVEDCPPLDGEDVKPRPVIVLSPVEVLRDNPAHVLVVASSSTDCDPKNHDRIPLPNHEENSVCTSGLPRRCCAVPRWYLMIERTKLQNPQGYISGAVLRRVKFAVDARLEEARKAKALSGVLDDPG